MSGIVILYLLTVGILISLFFTSVLKIRGPWGRSWTFWLITLLAIVAANLWIEPIGPYYGDIYWLPPLVVGVLIAFLLAASSPPSRRRKRLRKITNEVVEEQAGILSLGTFFWFVIVFMLTIILVGIVYRSANLT